MQEKDGAPRIAAGPATLRPLDLDLALAGGGRPSVDLLGVDVKVVSFRRHHAL